MKNTCNQQREAGTDRYRQSSQGGWQFREQIFLALPGWRMIVSRLRRGKYVLSYLNIDPEFCHGVELSSIGLTLLIHG